jgi:hypothetical protein
MSDSQAAEAENAYVRVTGESRVYRLEQKGEKDFNAYCRSNAPATFSVSAQPTNWVLVAPASGSLAITPGTSGVWKVKSKLGEDKPDGRIYLWNYYIKADGYNAKDITVPFGKTVKYFSYEGPNPVNSDWDVSGFEKSKQKSDTDSIIFNRSSWDITEWFTESYPTPKPGVYEIKANLTGKPSVNDSGVMTVVGAEFTENESHPYGFDDYSNWSLGPTDYYKVGTDRKGHCMLPYASVRDGYAGMSTLVVNPVSNKKNINISSSTSRLEFNPTTVITTRNIGFTAQVGWFSSSGILTAEMDETTLAELKIKAYRKRDYKCLLVRVGTLDNQEYTYSDLHSSYVKINYVFKQAVVVFGLQECTFDYPNAPTNAVWSETARHALRDYFNLNPPAEINPNEFKCISFMILGRDTGTAAAWGECPGRFSWVYTKTAYPFVCPHEMGHNFWLDDQYTKEGTVTILGPDTNNLMNSIAEKASVRDSQYRLRESQWDTIN